MHTAHWALGSSTVLVCTPPSGVTVRWAEPAVDVGAGVGRVGQDGADPRMGQRPEPQLPGPGASVGTAREAPLRQGANDRVRRADLGERGKHLRDRTGHLLVRVHDDGALLVAAVA